MKMLANTWDLATSPGKVSTKEIHGEDRNWIIMNVSTPLRLKSTNGLGICMSRIGLIITT